MSTPFARWAPAMSQVASDADRRALLAEIVRWRMANLVDVAGQRDSAWAMSSLFHALGDREAAEKQARSLHALCGTPPVAGRDEVEAAEAWLGVVTGKGRPQSTPASQAARRDRPPRSDRSDGSERPARQPRAERPERSERPDRSERPARNDRAEGKGRSGAELRDDTPRIAAALGLGVAGEYSRAFGALKGAPGPRVTLARTWLDLHRALAEPADQREKRLQGLLARLGRELPAPLEPSADPAPRTAPPAAAAPSAPAEPRPPSARQVDAARVAAAHAALTADAPPSAGDLVPLVAPIRHVRDLLDLAAGLDGADAEARAVALLSALHEVVSPDVRLLQATSIALRFAATSGPHGAAADLLLRSPAAARYGGPGVDVLVALVGALHAAGVSIDRVLHGLTRREQRDDAALDALAPHVAGLWRLLITSGAVRGEVWVVPGLSPEGRGAVPLLALRERPRVAVLPISAEGVGGWSELGGPEAVGWTGSEAEDVAAIVAAWGAAG
jgi:hypothetical protein